MIPAVNRFDFYYYRDRRDTDNFISFIQLIAHADKFCEDTALTEQELKKIKENRNLCGVFYEDAWSNRDGIVWFIKNEFATLDQAVIYYENLLDVAKIHSINRIHSLLQNTIATVKSNFNDIMLLNPDDYDSFEAMRSKFTTSEYSLIALNQISNRIVNNVDDFCRDENGNKLDKNFSGRLQQLGDDGVVWKEYTVLKGNILGECITYFNGNLKEAAILDGTMNRDSIKRWSSDGQLIFEKGYNCTKYWHNNGQLKMQINLGSTKIWDEKGNLTKEFDTKR